jgi:hypothetical protein
LNLGVVNGKYNGDERGKGYLRKPDFEVMVILLN